MLSFPLYSHSAGEPTVHVEKDTRRKEEPHIARRPAVSSRSVATPEMQPGNAVRRWTLDTPPRKGSQEAVRGPPPSRKSGTPVLEDGRVQSRDTLIHLSIQFQIYAFFFCQPASQPTPFEMKTRPFSFPHTALRGLNFLVHNEG
ncbi:hypothetical protein B0T18DRAFT_104626 [Schizothecium vesticola]|uniref:Uncharacterized protein n=1 Tax=Schizothecium vesticola TaxID=314040 RepID=A0AA40F1L2_9PEZI|nr:hypothetical protein B0T18DRAFT_104626 [Schizothecium vesticola]